MNVIPSQNPGWTIFLNRITRKEWIQLRGKCGCIFGSDGTRMDQAQTCRVFIAEPAIGVVVYNNI